MCEDLKNLNLFYPFLSRYPTTGKHNYIFDLYLLSKCKNVICSNSTFAWWGAWLNENPNKNVFIPSMWFSDARKETLHMDGCTIVNF